MRCYICDRALTTPSFNSDTQGYEPCETCMEVIHDTLASFLDKPSADEDDFGQDLSLDDYETRYHGHPDPYEN